ncbi:head morphogenesis protein [Klebsiella phage phi1_175008]|uniref:Uncharacterized protein n=2 Tax=Klebsiella phage phi1_175008 TaxID=3127744 RepID=A0AC61ZST1_9CAUD
MKAKVISPTGYSFDAEVIGKVFNVVEDFGHGVRLDIKNTSNDGLWNFSKGHVELIEDTVSEQDNGIKSLKVGSKVFLNPKSAWVISGKKETSNPLDVVGIITRYDQSDLDSGHLGITVEWSNGLINSYRDEDLLLIEQKESKTKVRQKPKKQTQTKVYISYRDGSSHLTKRVVNIVVRAEDKVIAVTSERNVDGLIIRENVTIPSTSVDWIDITGKEARHSYFFDEQGQVKASCQWFGKDHKFKTRSH